MRHLWSYLLLALTAFQCGAGLLVPLAQVDMARHRASVRLQNAAEGDETFVLHRLDFARGRSGPREWWHNGLLYDLQRVAMQGDSAYVTAFPDAHEQWLLAGFQRLFSADAGATSGTNPLAYLLVHFSAQFFLPAEHSWSLQPMPVGPTQHIFSFQAHGLAGFDRIFSPPPECPWRRPIASSHLFFSDSAARRF